MDSTPEKGQVLRRKFREGSFGSFEKKGFPS
jgi:hypothetical protein